MVRDLKGCSHKWSECPKTLNYRCTLCDAIGVTDPDKDPLSQNGIMVIRPGKEDLARMSRCEMGRWYRQFKPLILADIGKLGEKKTRQKWGIPSSSWSQLMSRFSCRADTAGTVKRKVSLDTLPSFPEFSDSWPESVQLGWLEVYRELFRGTK